MPSPTSSDEIHRAPGFDHVSCQGCHIPYALQPALLFRDITIPGATGTTSQYLSADPLDPANPDKSRWHPPFMRKLDEDGVERLFPCNIWITIYWADWDRNGTPEDYSDDIIAPIPTWRIDQLTGGDPQAGCRDCHRAMQFDSPVFDRRVLIDPFGPTAQPLYLTVRGMTGLNPP